MINPQLHDLEEEDKRYNLHVGAEPPETYNIILVYPSWRPPQRIIQEVPLQSPEKIKENLAKLGIFF
jgi:hypothetical protein